MYNHVVCRQVRLLKQIIPCNCKQRKVHCLRRAYVSKNSTFALKAMDKATNESYLPNMMHYSTLKASSDQQASKGSLLRSSRTCAGDGKEQNRTKVWMLNFTWTEPHR